MCPPFTFTHDYLHAIYMKYACFYKKLKGITNVQLTTTTFYRINHFPLWEEVCVIPLKSNIYVLRSEGLGNDPKITTLSYATLTPQHTEHYGESSKQPSKGCACLISFKQLPTMSS